MDNQEWSIKDIDPNNEILLHGGKWSEEAKRRVSEARRAGRSVFEMFGDVYKKAEKTVGSTVNSASKTVGSAGKTISKTASNLIRVAKKGVFSQGSKTTTITRVKSITDAQGHKVGPKKGNGRKVGPKTAEAKRRKTDYERGKAMDKRYANEKRRKTDSARGKAMDERERRNRSRKSNTERERSHAMSKGVKREAERNRRDRMAKIDQARGKAMDKRISEERRRKADQDRGKAMDERERRNRDRKRKAAAERKEQKRFYDEKRRKTDYERGKWMDRRELRNRQEGMKTLKDNARSTKNLPDGRVNRSGIGHDFGKAVDQARQKGALKPNKEAYNRAQFEKGRRGEYNDRQFKKGRRGEYNDRMNDFQKRKKGLVKRGSLAGSLRQSATFDYQAALTAVSKKKIKMN